jgi:hypothetical protein
MSRRGVALLVVVPLVVGTAALASAGGLRSSGNGSPGAGGIDPSNFVRHVTNPYYPLPPGRLLVYRGVRDGQVQIDRVFVTHRTRTIAGVTATVVRDVAKHGSTLLEDTTDYYAQDKQGNVWYLGERTTAYDNGHANTEGSWMTGVHGAVPGIIMEANPEPPDAYRQEFWRGQAEDMAWVLHRGKTLQVPIGRLSHVLLTMEWTRLEPKVIDMKWYGRGLGIIRELSASGPLETSQLIRVQDGG